MSVCGYIHIYLAVYDPEIIGGFGLEGKPKAVCGLGRTNYGGLRNVRPPIIDPLHNLVLLTSNSERTFGFFNYTLNLTLNQ